MKKKTNNNYFSFKYISLAIVLSIMFLGVYFIKLNENINKELNFKVGNFTILSSSKEVYPTDINKKGISRYSSELFSVNDDCPSVEGVETIEIHRKIENLQQTASPKYIVTSWNLDDLSFANDTAKENSIRAQESVQNLKLYIDKNKLLNLVFDKFFNPNRYSIISTSPWRGLDSCGGYFSYPILIQSIEQDKFDEVIYTESFEGQDITNPSRILVIRKNDDWLIFKEENYLKLESYFIDTELCFSQKKINVWKCAEKVWATRYRNEDENQKWIDKIINIVNYTPNG